MFIHLNIIFLDLGNDCSISWCEPDKNDLEYFEGRREEGKKDYFPLGGTLNE